VQAALLEIDPLAPGVARRLASGVVRHSLEVGALDPTTDWFRLGVGGERPQVVERYVSPGSVAWAAHAFITLAMPPDHPFWAAPELALPADDGASGELAAAGAGLLATWSGTTGETHLYNAWSGHPADIPDHDYSAGYGKLAYHSAFPFDLPIEAGAAPGADSAIVALEPDGNMWRVAHRNETLRGSAGPGWIRSTYLLPTRSGPTRLTTVVLLIEGVEVRVSAVHPAGSLRLREGGAALGLDGGQRVRIELGDGGGLILIGDGGRTVGIRALIGHDAAGSEETTPERANLVQERACHPYVEESSPSDRERVVASASIATARDGDLRGTLEAIDARVEGDDVTVTWPSGSAIVSFGRRPPATRPVAGWTIRGSALRVVRASLDGSSFAGEMIATIDGAVRLDRPGTLAIKRHETDVDVTVASGFRLDAAWAGPDLVDLGVRHGAGPFEPLGRLTEHGRVPDALVRRLKRRLGTRLVTLRLGRE
jgi:hypothetical protein